MARLLDKSNTPQAVAVALAVFLVVNGFLFYRYQQQLEANNATSTTIDVEAVAAEEEAITPIDQEPDISEEPAAPTEEQEPATEEVATVLTESAPPPLGEVEVVRLVVRVTGAPSWLRVQEDRQIILAQVSEPGFSREFVADQAISLQVGNAGAVQVEVDGRNLGPLGADGEVATRTYTTQKGREASE